MKPSLFLLLFACLPALGSAQTTTGYASGAGAGRVPSTNLDIPPTAEALQATLYELTDQYHAAQQLHWNVTGPLFYTLHELYEEIYTGLAGKIDEVAERKLALDRPADARPAAVAASADLSPAVAEDFVTDKQSLELLTARHLTISNRLAERIAATGETDPVTQDLLISVKDMIDHQLWKMRSFLK